MGKFKRPKPATPPKPVLTKRDRLELFMRDWGRVAVPLGVVLVLVILKFLGIVEDTGLGYLIGILFLLTVVGAAGWLVWSEPFPAWAKGATIAAAVLVLPGAVVPLTQIVFPGQPVFQTEISVRAKEGSESKKSMESLPPEISGFYRMEVFAKSLAERLEARGIQGRYHLKVAGKDITGSFSDIVQSVRGWRGRARTVEYKHFMDVHGVVLPEGEKTLEAVRIDQSIGPVLRVSLFSVLIPPTFAYILLALAFFVAVYLDGRCRTQTERWRLAPWFCMALAYIAIFESAYARGNVTNAAVWSAIFGGVGGFAVGWAVSLVVRKIMVRLGT